MYYQNQDATVNNSSYSTAGLYFRSGVFFIYSALSITLYSFVCLVALPTPLRFRHALIRGFLYVYFWMLKVVCRIDYRVEGLENIPKDQHGIIMCKHSSAWETFFLPLYFHSPAAIAKRELAWIPFFGWGLAVTEPIFINRKNKRTAMQQIIEKGKRFLAQGRWIMVFPEGTRVPYGQVGQYKVGGARLAVETGYPIFPVAHNAGRFWPRRSFLKMPGTVTVVIGPMLESKGRKPEELLAQTKQWIETTMTRL